MDFDDRNRLASYKDLISGKVYPLNQEFLYYHGHDRSLLDGSKQASGAYAFRPDPNTPFNFSGNINLEIVNVNLENLSSTFFLFYQILDPYC